jgi:hypothetical protein
MIYLHKKQRSAGPAAFSLGPSRRGSARVPVIGCYLLLSIGSLGGGATAAEGNSGTQCPSGPWRGMTSSPKMQAVSAPKGRDGCAHDRE